MMSSSPNDLPSHLVTHASLGLTGQDLNPDAITSLLGVSPHRQFRRGDQYEGRGRDGTTSIYTRPSGVWSLDSTRLVSSRDPVDHVRAVVQMVHPFFGRWRDLVNKGFNASLWIVHARVEGEMGYTIDLTLLQAMADLKLNVSITCNIIRSGSETD